MKDKSKILARCELFKTLPAEALELIAAKAAPLEVNEGDPLIVEGKPSAFLYVIAEGTVDYIKRVDAKSGLVICRWAEGDVVGLDAVIDGKDYFVSAVASTPVKCLRLPAADFHALCDADPQYEHRIYAQALLIQSARLRQITQRLREFLAKILK